MNFLQIAQYIADELEEDQPETLEGNNPKLEIRRFRNWINKAYNVVLLSLNRKNDYRETSGTITTSSGTESYDIPSGILNIDQIVIEDDPPINILPWTEYERYKSDNYLITTVGYPDACAIWNRKVHFYPTPDNTYTVTVRGQENMTRLDGDDDVPDLPADFHQVVAEFGLYYGMQFENNPRAGSLMVDETTGQLTAQGGQAAEALLMLNLVRRNSRDHATIPPRMVSTYELKRLNALRRVRTQ